MGTEYEGASAASTELHFQVADLSAPAFGPHAKARQAGQQRGRDNIKVGKFGGRVCVPELDCSPARAWAFLERDLHQMVERKSRRGWIRAAKHWQVDCCGNING